MPADIFDPMFAIDGIPPGSGRAADISEKIREAEFFLGLMEMTATIDEFRWLTCAWLNAARAAVDWMAWRVKQGANLVDRDGEPVLELISARVEKVMEAYFTITRASGSKVFAQPVHPVLTALSGIRQEQAHRDFLHLTEHGEDDAAEQSKPGLRFVFVEQSGPGTRVVPFAHKVMEVLDEMQERALDAND